MSSHTPKKPSQEVLDWLTANYTYDRDAGEVFNNKRGKPAAGVDAYGYRSSGITVNKKKVRHKAHHIVWFFEYGEWPTSCMDHIDGVKSNNHYTNLRLVTNRENIQAHYMTKKSSSPYQGVSKDKRTGGFFTRIRSGEDSKQIYLGYCACELEAARAYDKALVGLGLKPVNVEIMKELQKDD